jgi:nucleoside-diphosphate-sugar epimerase
LEIFAKRLNVSARRVFITGANGWIGSHLAELFLARGWKVVALVRRPGTIPGVEYRGYRLEDGKAPLEGADSNSVLIHCAYAKYSRKNRGSDELNLSAARALLSQARERGMKFVFFSSLSAHDAAESHYGKHKLALENIFDPSRDLILRPGFVLGEGGLAGEIIKSLRRLPLIPIFSGGNQPIQTISVEDLGELTFRLVDSSGSKILAEEKPIPIRELYRGIAESQGMRPRFISLPYGVFFRLLSIPEAIGITLPVTTENLLGLKHLRVFPIEKDIAGAVRSFQETLKQIEKAPAKKKPSWLARKLKPSPSEIRRLALCETDPKLYPKFKAIARGPVFAVLMLFLIGVAAVFMVPLRLLRPSEKNDG